MDDGGGLDGENLVFAGGPPSDVLTVGGGKTGLRLTGRMIGALALVVALMVGAIVVATVRSGDTGEGPESVVPGTSFAFAKIDLDPPADQRAALGAFAKKFPLAESNDFETLRRNAINALLTNWKLDYDKDVKPWLGRRAAVAGFPDAAGKSKVVFVLQTDDPDAAKAALAKLPDAPAVDARRGYVLVAEDSTVLAAALAAADRAVLSDNEAFKADTAKLQGDPVVVGWIDNKAAVAVLLADSPQDGGGDPYTDQFRKNAIGRSVVGVHAATNYVEITGVTTGAPAMAVGRPERLATLPDDSIGAAYLREPGPIVKNGFSGFGLAGQYIFGFPGMLLYGISSFGSESETVTASASATAYPCPVPSMPPGAKPDSLDAGWAEYCEMPAGIATATAGTSYAPCPAEDGKCVSYGRSEAPLPSAAPMPALSPAPCPAGAEHCMVAGQSSKGEVTNEFAHESEPDIFGLVRPLADQLTGGATLVLGSLPAPGGKRSPDMALIGPVADPVIAKSAAQKVADVMAEEFEEKPAVGVQDGVLTLASDAAYAQGLTGSLGKTALFTTAMGELGDNVHIAVFANLERVRDAASGYPKEWRPVSAVGASLARHGDDNVLRIRVVAG